MVGHIYIVGEIGAWGVNLQSVKDQADPMASSYDVHIYSPGGEVYEGYAIYGYLKSLGKPITVYIEGLAASIATVIAMAGDTIIINPLSQFMIHNPSGFVGGDADELRKYAEQLDAIKGQLIEAYLTKSNLSEKELWKMLDEETWLTSEQAVEYGFANEIAHTLKAVAYFKKNMKDEKELEQKLDGFFSKIETVITNAFKPKAEAVVEETEEVKTLKAENEALKSQLAEAATKADHAEAVSNGLKQEFENIKEELGEFKNLIKKKDTPAAVAANTDSPSAPGAFEQAAKNVKNILK